MAKKITSFNRFHSEFPKALTGIQGLDEITGGGLPRGRTTLVCGSPGCGKTLLGLEFLVRGAMQMGEPGVMLAFEETAEELTQNVRSLGFDLEKLVEDKKLILDTIPIEATEFEESGEYDLEGLFIRLGDSINSIGAKRIVLDTIEVLFGGLSNQGIIRSELRRLFQWLKSRNMTSIVTGERGEKSLTRQGLEEYVSDCVILLDHRVNEQMSTRRLRVVKYRGSHHGTNEFPFLIERQGLSVLPITSLQLEHKISKEKISTGITQLDEMFGGEGVYRGSTVLITGGVGTGKTSLVSHFANASCRKGERVFYFAFEESSPQIIRNMRSIGLPLEKWMNKGLLHIEASRPTLFGLESHLVNFYNAVKTHHPKLVIMDPINDFLSIGSTREIKALFLRMVDFLKSRQITLICTGLISHADSAQETEIGVSSLADTWILLTNPEIDREHHRQMYILKSRGMAHSNQVREYTMSQRGWHLKKVSGGNR
ncbi:MAG TPA: circadian clock protein KaiC [Nitrospirales bacterium]|nr:KaiC 1 [Nitrospiraceae bacterium]HNP27941.1 circadian clock protein KaiC [Nitrospirales bacterium]